ncbi:hypothetical protein V6N11_017762 [Hibiscus sabdariffa]|uniref:Uncharacterized protein n=1 Tax=Hibiscus sabdariffa TaxID=183260 RepID=A0ABR2TZM4_9ROSI
MMFRFTNVFHSFASGRRLGTEHRVEAWVIIWQAQNGVDGSCVGCNSPATDGCIIFSSRVAGVELDHPAEISTGWLPRQAKPAKVMQPVVYDWFEAVIDLAVIKEESLLFPSILGCNLSLSG